MTPVCRNVLSLLVLLFTTKLSGFLYSDLNAKCKPLAVAISDMGKVDNTYVQKKTYIKISGLYVLSTCIGQTNYNANKAIT